MFYLEMARDKTHGGGSWAFPNCVWAPAKKRDGRSWPFWKKVLEVKEGDTVIHLRGLSPVASFVGYSIASGDGFETNRRPPDPSGWGYAEKFFRGDLSDFTPFHWPIILNRLFLTRKSELDGYFDRNKARGAQKSNIFYVRQAERLQCLNGAYLSDVDEELLTALFGAEEFSSLSPTAMNVISVETGSQFATIRSRLGQAKFSREIKNLYKNRCCFLGCSVKDSRFLVASHIARWSDNERLRGQMGNGLCLCVFHDKAFEIGIFTLDENFKVFVNPKERRADSPIIKNLISHQGERISLAEILPLEDSLLEHWIRVDITP